MRGEMSAGFAQIETRISIVYVVLVSLRVPQLISTSSDHNGLARVYNAAISSSQSSLHALRTTNNIEPAGFPVNSAQLSALPGMIDFYESK